MNMKMPNSASGNRKKIVILILSAIVLVSVIAAIIVGLAGGKGTSEDGKDPENSQASGTDEGKADEPADLQSQIDSLILRYRQAFAGADIETLKTLYNTDTVMNADTIEATAQIITGYENTKCLIKDGLDEKSKVVFVYDDLKVAGVNALIPNITYVYVTQDDAGSYYVYPGEFDQSSGGYVYSSEILQYVSELIKEKDVNDLYTTVNEKFHKVMSENADAQAFMEKLTAQDATAAAEETAEGTGESQNADESQKAGETQSTSETQSPGETDDSAAAGGAVAGETLENE